MGTSRRNIGRSIGYTSPSGGRVVSSGPSGRYSFGGSSSSSNRSVSSSISSSSSRSSTSSNQPTNSSINSGTTRTTSNNIPSKTEILKTNPQASDPNTGQKGLYESKSKPEFVRSTLVAQKRAEAANAAAKAADEARTRAALKRGVEPNKLKGGDVVITGTKDTQQKPFSGSYNQKTKSYEVYDSSGKIVKTYPGAKEGWQPQTITLSKQMIQRNTNASLNNKVENSETFQQGQIRELQEKRPISSQSTINTIKDNQGQIIGYRDTLAKQTVSAPKGKAYEGESLNLYERARYENTRPKEEEWKPGINITKLSQERKVYGVSGETYTPIVKAPTKEQLEKDVLTRQENIINSYYYSTPKFKMDFSKDPNSSSVPETELKLKPSAKFSLGYLYQANQLNKLQQQLIDIESSVITSSVLEKVKQDKIPLQNVKEIQQEALSRVLESTNEELNVDNYEKISKDIYLADSLLPGARKISISPQNENLAYQDIINKQKSELSSLRTKETLIKPSAEFVVSYLVTAGVGAAITKAAQLYPKVSKLVTISTKPLLAAYAISESYNVYKGVESFSEGKSLKGTSIFLGTGARASGVSYAMSYGTQPIKKISSKIEDIYFQSPIKKPIDTLLNRKYRLKGYKYDKDFKWWTERELVTPETQKARNYAAKQPLLEYNGVKSYPKVIDTISQKQVRGFKPSDIDYNIPIEQQEFSSSQIFGKTIQTQIYPKAYVPESPKVIAFKEYIGKLKFSNYLSDSQTSLTLFKGIKTIPSISPSFPKPKLSVQYPLKSEIIIPSEMSEFYNLYIIKTPQYPSALKIRIRPKSLFEYAKTSSPGQKTVKLTNFGLKDPLKSSIRQEISGQKAVSSNNNKVISNTISILDKPTITTKTYLQPKQAKPKIERVVSSTPSNKLKILLGLNLKIKSDKAYETGYTRIYKTTPSLKSILQTDTEKVYAPGYTSLSKPKTKLISGTELITDEDIVYDNAYKFLPKLDIISEQIIEQNQEEDTTTRIIIPTLPEFKPPEFIPDMPPPPPPIIGCPIWEPGGGSPTKKKRKKIYSRQGIPIYTPDFTARLLGISVKPNKTKLKKLLGMSFTGFETRAGINLQ